MKYNTCCFTGHRNIPSNNYYELQKRLETEVIELIRQDVVYFGNGGALGFDTMAALSVIKLREEYSHIRLIMVLPCNNQTKDWDEEDIKIYNHILDRANKIVYTSDEYYDGCMRKRNLHLVKNSEICVAYMKHMRSGTAQTVRLAKERGLRIINLA